MYTVKSFKDGYALIINEAKVYETEFLAESLEDGEGIALELNRPDMYQALADHRFSIETSGLALGDMQILTDRESQGQLNSAYVVLKNGLIPDTDWKAESGWGRLDLASLEPVAKAVAAHARACFRGERVVQESIDGAKTLAEILKVDVAGLFDLEYAAAYAAVMEPVVT